MQPQRPPYSSYPPQTVNQSAYPAAPAQHQAAYPAQAPMYHQPAAAAAPHRPPYPGYHPQTAYQAPPTAARPPLPIPPHYAPQNQIPPQPVTAAPINSTPIASGQVIPKPAPPMAAGGNKLDRLAQSLASSKQSDKPVEVPPANPLPIAPPPTAPVQTASPTKTPATTARQQSPSFKPAPPRPIPPPNDRKYKYAVGGSVYCMYLGGRWYRCEILERSIEPHPERPNETTPAYLIQYDESYRGVGGITEWVMEECMLPLSDEARVRQLNAWFDQQEKKKAARGRGRGRGRARGRGGSAVARKGREVSASESEEEELVIKTPVTKKVVPASKPDSAGSSRANRMAKRERSEEKEELPVKKPTVTREVGVEKPVGKTVAEKKMEVQGEKGKSEETNKAAVESKKDDPAKEVKAETDQVKPAVEPAEIQQKSLPAPVSESVKPEDARSGVVETKPVEQSKTSSEAQSSEVLPNKSPTTACVISSTNTVTSS